jgi:hypothetical protein
MTSRRQRLLLVSGNERRSRHKPGDNEQQAHPVKGVSIVLLPLPGAFFLVTWSGRRARRRGKKEVLGAPCSRINLEFRVYSRQFPPWNFHVKTLLQDYSIQTESSRSNYARRTVFVYPLI